MKSRLLLLGYSGKKNFGDDLLLKQAYDSLLTSNAEIHIHTSEPDSSYLSFWFPKAVVRYNKKLDYTFLKNYDDILHYGGGVFFDYGQTGWLRYIRKRLSLIRNYYLTRKQGIRFSGIGIGLGPFSDINGERLCFLRLKNFDYLNVRDNVSFELSKKHKLNNTTIGEDLSLANYAYYHSFKVPEGNRSSRIIICPRKYPHGDKKDNYLKNLISACKVLSEKEEQIFVYGFQLNHDEPVMEAFTGEGYKINIWNPDTMSIEDLLKEFANAKLIITARMHGLYVAGMLDVPVVGIGVHPKLKLASQIFSKSICLPESFEQNDMLQAIDKLRTLPGNNMNLLSEKEIQCKEEYLKILKWLDATI